MSTLTHSPHAPNVGRKSDSAFRRMSAPLNRPTYGGRRLRLFRPTTIHVKEALAV